MSHPRDRWHQERDFHAATNASDWHRAEHLELVALKHGLTDADRDAWHPRLDASRLGIARCG